MQPKVLGGDPPLHWSVFEVDRGDEDGDRRLARGRLEPTLEKFEGARVAAFFGALFYARVISVPWLAGAGIRRGHIHGTTDEIGLKAGDQKVTVHDWHATILHQLGMHHEELFYRRNGLKERLTSVFPAKVIEEICS